MLMTLINTVEIHDLKTQEEEYVEKGNWDQEIDKQEYEKKNLPISSIKSEDTIVMEKILQGKPKSNQQNQMSMSKIKKIS